MSMGQVGGNSPYGNQGDYRYQYYQYPQGNYAKQPYAASYYSSYGNNGYSTGQSNGYGNRTGNAPYQGGYNQSAPGAKSYYVPSYPSVSVTPTTVSTASSGSSSGVQSTSNDNNTDKPKASNDSPGKELITESQSLQSEVQSDAKAKKAEGGGSDGGGGSGDAMKAISVLMTVAGVVTSMDLIAKALQVTGFIMKTVGQGLEVAGTAMDASGMALIASGQALCSNPFTAAAGVAMISAGTALKVAGNTMKVAGKVLKVVGNVMEKTARALQKALKVLMRGAKNAARRGMNKFRKMKMARAAKAARKAKLKAKKLPKGSAKHTKYKAQQAAQQAKIKNLAQSVKKTNATIARKQAKNQAAINGLKTSAQNGVSKVKAAPGQAASRMSNGAKKQWTSYTQQLKGTFKQSNTIKGAGQNAKAGLKQGWKQGATKANGTNKFSAKWSKIKTNTSNMKADLKSQFRKTDSQVAKADKAKKAKSAQANTKVAKANKAEKAKSAQVNAKDAKAARQKAYRQNAIEKLKLDPKVTAKLDNMKAGTAKPATNPSQATRYAKDDMAVTKASKAKPAASTKDDMALAGSKSGKPATTKADRAAEIKKLQLDPNVAAKADKLAKGGAASTKTAGSTAAQAATKNPIAWGKITRWGGGVAMMGFGGAMIADSFGSSSGGNDYLAIQGSKTWDEFHQKYDTTMTNANAGRDPYRSGYYDASYLGNPNAYPGTPRQVPGYNYTGNYPNNQYPAGQYGQYPQPNYPNYNFSQQYYG